MGARTVYLVPVAGEMTPRAYRQKAVRCLLEMGVIDEEEDEDLGGYLPGPRSLSLLANKGAAGDGFESCSVYASRRLRLIPQEPAVSPRCPKCRQNLEEEFYRQVNEAEEDSEDEVDYAAIRVPCPKCGGVYALDELEDRVGVYLAKKYVSFEGVQGALSDRWLSEFAEKLGLEHRAYEYWYT